MAVTKGHGNPKWTADEVVLALDLYFDCNGKIPDSGDKRIKELSAVLRAFPEHAEAARKESFRNPAGVAFKLQNLRQVATGKGLSNVSKVDREIWASLGKDPMRTKELAALIRAGIDVQRGVEVDNVEVEDEDEFAEGKTVTRTHLRRERAPQLRRKLLAQRRGDGRLHCDICGVTTTSADSGISEAIFECHHVRPLATQGERKTKVADLALLCANCHRKIHRAMALKKRWLSIADAKETIL